MGGGWETFHIHGSSDGKFAIQSSHEKFLCARQGYTNRPQLQNCVVVDRVGGGWETFKKEKGQDGIFALKTCHDSYICANNNGTLTQSWEWSGWETFRQEGGGKKTAFKTVCHDGKYLSAKPDGSFVFANTWAGAWETFHVHGSSDDNFAIQTDHGKFLSAPILIP